MNLSCAVQSSIQTKGAEDTYFGDTNGNKTAKCASRRLTWARLEDFFRRRNFFPNFESNFPKENIGTEPGPRAAGWLSAQRSLAAFQQRHPDSLSRPAPCETGGSIIIIPSTRPRPYHPFLSQFRLLLYVDCFYLSCRGHLSPIVLFETRDVKLLPSWPCSIQYRGWCLDQWRAQE